MFKILLEKQKNEVKFYVLGEKKILSIFLSSPFQSSEVENHPQSHLDLLCRRKREKRA
jgi:hypothetical protein